MFKRVDSNYTSTWPKSASIPHRLSLMKGKKGAPRNRFSFGEQSSVVGVLSLSSSILSQPKVCANSVVDVVPFTASAGSTMGKQGQASIKSDPSHDVVQPQTQESMKAAINEEKCEGREVAILKPSLGNSNAMQCEDARVSNRETKFGLDGDQANHGFHPAIS